MCIGRSHLLCHVVSFTADADVDTRLTRASIWMAKFTVSVFLRRLTQCFWKKDYEWDLRGIRIFLVVTFVMVLIATLAECQPVTHY